MRLKRKISRPRTLESRLEALAHAVDEAWQESVELGRQASTEGNEAVWQTLSKVWPHLRAAAAELEPDRGYAANAGEPLKLYVWPHAGGWARHWEVPQELSARAPWFFMFGRYGGGWSPFSSAKFGTREETQAAAEAAHQRFGLPVEIFYGQAPPASER